MVLGKSTRFVLAPSGSYERHNLASKGDWASLGDTRTTPGELVARSSMGRGAKSKVFVRLSELAVGLISQGKLLQRQRKFPLPKCPEAARGLLDGHKPVASLLARAFHALRARSAKARE